MYIQKINTNGNMQVRKNEQRNNCKIWGFHGSDYDDYNLLGDDAVWLL
jgi:hypothetical protein